MNKHYLIFATAELTKDEKNDLVKISSCVLIDGDIFEEPDWFIGCNGKLWIENGKLS